MYLWHMYVIHLAYEYKKYSTLMSNVSLTTNMSMLSIHCSLLMQGRSAHFLIFFYEWSFMMM